MKFSKLYLLLSIFASNIATATTVVSLSTCAKVSDPTKPFILILNTGDDFIGSITQCAKDAKLLGASISGIGQLHDPTLAYFTSNPADKPKLKKFAGYYELASFNGNIANTNNNYFTHIHAALADKEFHGIAGHINSAKVGLTAEVTIIPFSEALQRTVDPQTGFGPIVH